MESLSTSWRSGSLTFMSPEIQQQPHNISFRHLAAATSSSPSASPTRFTVLPSSRKKMAKILSVTLAIFIIALVVGIVLADTASTPKPGRSKLRAKSLTALRKRKVAEPGESPTETPGGPSTNAQYPSVTPLEGEGGYTTTVKPKSKKAPKTATGIRSDRPPRDSNGPLPEGCGECDMSTCKSYTEKSCQAGLVISML